ncbi:MAG: hypothetical protein HXY26_01790 [Hydrogenophilaceae bacterium]|nr:hypothetical protein [Hydrogenophilaceae bacterium]
MPEPPNLLSYAVVQWASSILLSLLIVAVVVALILSVVGWGYVWLHPVAAYEDDLGYGLVMMAGFVICAVIAVPAGGLLAWRLKTILARKIHEHNS